MSKLKDIADDAKSKNAADSERHNTAYSRLTDVHSQLMDQAGAQAKEIERLTRQNEERDKLVESLKLVRES